VGKDALKNPGVAPDAPSDQDAITIEHTKGAAHLIIRQDGSIEIKGKKIQMSADDIILNAGNVKVQCDAMDVADKQ
jgi:hypothetical protein